jgi:outer membrane protein assembly factor BamB
MVRALRIGLALAIALGGSVSAADWPQWRGPHGNGVGDEKDLPLRWTATENVAWKADLGGAGVSSPIVAGTRIFVTSQIGTGISRQGPRLAQGADAASAGERAPSAARAAADTTIFLVEAFDRTAGRRLWEYRFEAVGPLPSVHDKHNLASPSPVTDGALVYAWFGTGQIVALDMNGKLVWERNLGKEIAPFDINWGHKQLADALPGSAHSHLRSRARVLSPRRGQANRQGAVRRIAARDVRHA